MASAVRRHTRKFMSETESTPTPSPAIAPEAAPAAAPAPAASAAPTLTFADFGLAPEIQRALTDQGYTRPTPIQEQAIPVVLQGRDVMGAAQTGTGKTAGFSLPIIQLLMAHASSSMSPARHPVRALILTPTRELAVQVAENVKAYAKHTPLRSTVVFGGMDMKPQTVILRGGVEIVIATPGRLLDHVEQKNVSLGQVQMLVMDEADRMLDMGFLPDLQRIINMLPKQRQNLMFSATFSPEIKKLAASFLNSPVTIEVARSNATADKVTQIVYKVPESQKVEVVEYIIRQRELKQVIVFSNTKIGASKLARHLEQSDITDLPCVINYDLPYNAEDYVHRIGRTGRAGASGDALSVYSDKDERLLVDIEKLIKQSITRGELTGFTPGPASTYGERSGPRGREERAPRSMEARPRRPEGEAGPRSSERPVRAPGAMPRRDKVDPWFLKPYEPAVSAKPVSTEQAAATGTKPARPKIAALLGGGPKA